MATQTPIKKRPKGDRLNWTLLKDVKPISLNVSLIKGNIVAIKPTAAQQHSDSGKLNLLIP
ncbi:MAG TPA: hypothetical protein VN040_24285 [Pseudosphingobacterium sp.]|nr:hypothetical protein [Pseudosphingobacterium sp.]